MLSEPQPPKRGGSRTIVSISGLCVEFPVKTPLRERLTLGRRAVQAVNGVDIDIARGSSLGIVGESGSGKTTLAKAICGLVKPTAGSIRIDVERRDSRPPPVQMVFQDPTFSLDPRQTAGDAIEEMLRAHHLVPRADVSSRRDELLDLVGLSRRAADALPRHLSGGQRQRVAIARALALEPPVLVADEAVASLDVSVKAGILNLLRELQRSLELTLILVTHDLATLRHVTDEVAVMYLGRILEHGPVQAVLGTPRHPYTAALAAAAPQLRAARRLRPPALTGEPPSPLAPPAGCAFHPRCRFAVETCRTTRPQLLDVGDRRLACPIR